MFKDRCDVKGLSVWTTPESTSGLPQELLERVNLAAQAAGVRAFDWDLVGNRLTLDRMRLNACLVSPST